MRRLVTEGGLRGIVAYLWARFARLYPPFLLLMIRLCAAQQQAFGLLDGTSRVN
jgi:hypothetical protein